MGHKSEVATKLSVANAMLYKVRKDVSIDKFKYVYLFKSVYLVDSHLNMWLKYEYN